MSASNNYHYLRAIAQSPIVKIAKIYLILPHKGRRTEDNLDRECVPAQLTHPVD
ncbi:hypothetical protein [Chroococcidiopsis sp.]|uniref:hypothetical protein n=1 Tax=Chroococcidiopsis sp. TaxID=3088168 RepID=UPI003F3E64DF